MKENMVESFVSPKIEVKSGALDGVGSFAISDIKQGEIVFIKGGYIVRREEIFTSKVINSYLPLYGEYFIAATTPEEEPSIKLYVNHSCNPNCGIRGGNIIFVAMRDIKPGEELTFDYATVDDEDYSFECSCGADNCRKIVTGRDWKRKDLQEKYGNYFAIYLLDKINSQ